MKGALISLLLSAVLVVSDSANAVNNASATGTITFLQQMGSSAGYQTETLIFAISSQPGSGICGKPYFVISPNSVTDAQMRKNYLAMILQAKSTGSTVQIGFDNLGGFCDQQFIGIYYLWVS